MLTSYYNKTSILSLLAALLFIGACTEDSNIIFDPDHEYDAIDPVVTQVIPERSAFAGVGTVTETGIDPVIITGQNFGTDKSQIIVYFGTSRAEILSLRDDEILVTPPNDPGEERRIRVVKVRAEKYSEFPEDPDEQYELRQIFTPYPVFEDADTPRAITTGFDGELYAMNVVPAGNDGIVMVDREEEEMVPISAKGEAWIYNRIHHGPDGYVYASRGGNVNVIYRVDASIGLGGGDAPIPEIFTRDIPRAQGVQDLTFDSNGYLWACYPNNILRADPASADAESYSMQGDIRTIRYHDGYLYASIVRDGESGIWRVPITGDGTPGEEELYVMMPNDDILVRSMAFTAAGDLVMAVNTIESLMIFRNGQVQELYPGIVPPGATTLAVSSDNPEQLIIGIIGTTIDGVTSQTRVLKLEMEQEMELFHGTF